MQALEQKLNQCVEAGEIDLPILPAVSAEVMSLTQSDDVDAAKLASLIQNDLSLSGNVMGLANSAAYGGSVKMQTLQQAITRLGLREIAQIAMTISVGQSVFKKDASTQEIIDYLWKHSLATACWAKEIARLSRSNTEVAFLCGLLHQIGKPVAVNTITQLLESENESLKDQQEFLNILDKYNKVIGAALAQEWQFPNAVVEVINHIDEYFSAPAARQEAMVVNAARFLAVRTLDGSDEAQLLTAMLGEEVFEELNFYQDDLELLSEKLDSIKALLSSVKI